MNKKIILAFAITFLLLGLIAFYPLIRQKVAPVDEEEKFDNFFTSLTKDSIESVKITGKDNEDLLITYGDLGWEVNGYKADQGNINSLAEEFVNVEFVRLVSKNSDNFEDYLLDEDRVYEVEIKQFDGKQINFGLGKYSDELAHFYIRHPKDGYAYMVKGQIRSALAGKLDHLRDKRIIQINKESIGLIEYKSDEKNYVIKVKDDKWTITQGWKSGEADRDAVKTMQDAVSDLVAEGFEYNMSEEGIENLDWQEYKLSSKYEDELVKFLYVFEDDKYFVKKIDEDYIYRVSGNLMEKILVDESSIIEE